MINQTRQKNTKILSPQDTIEFLNRLKTQKLETIAQHFQITIQAARYQKRKHHAYSDEQIDRAITNLEKKFYTYAKTPVPRNYEKEDLCEHTFCTLFLKCPFCTLVLGENELDRAIEILLKKKAELENKKVIEVQL